MPLVSVITVNYKQPVVTGELLKSLAQINYPKLEVILVDNEQPFSDEGYYRQLFPGIKVINSQVNLGFAGANNLGIQAAKGDYLFFLNNDTELENGVIEKLLMAFDSPKVGAVSPVLRYAENPAQIQFAGYTPIHPITGRNTPLKSMASPTLAETPYFHGAAVMIPKKVLLDAGNMAEDYFLYYEELDWSQRIREAGYELKVLKTTHVLHKESISTGKNSPLKVYYQTRNRVHFMRRNFDNSWGFLLFFCMISLPKNVIGFSLKKQKSHLKAFNLGWRHALIENRFGPIDPKILTAA